MSEGRKRSRIWTIFTQTSVTSAKCSICQNELSTRGGSTANLHRHLTAKHPRIQPLRKVGSPAKTRADAVLTYKASTSLALSCASRSTCNKPTSATVPTGPPMVSQGVQQSTITTHETKPIDPVKQTMVDEKLAIMVSKGCQPFSVVEDNGFKDYTHALDPSYILPSRKTLSDILVPHLYEKTLAKIKDEVQAAQTVCITADCWTSVDCTRIFVSLTCHFLLDYKMKSNLLECFECTERHTAESIATELNRITDEWNITGKIVACVSDHASPITAAVKLLGWMHLPCFAHTIHHVVRDSLKVIKPIVDKVKSVFGYLYGSSVASEQLTDVLRQMGHPELQLQQNVAPRWSSTFHMLKRLTEIREAIVTTLTLVNPTMPILSPGEWDIITQVCDVLKPIEEASTEINAERYVTASKIIIMARGLQKVITTMQKSEIFEEPVMQMIRSISIGMARWFRQIEQKNEVAEAALLDPRFKKRAFINEKIADDVVKRITISAGRVKLPSDEQQEENSEVKTLNEVTQSSGAMFWEDFDERVTGLVSSRSGTPDVMMEVRTYLGEPLLHRDSDPLVWWQNRKMLYQRLTSLMIDRLCIVSTSVSLERVFFKNELTTERGRIKSDNVWKLAFLSANLS